MSLDFGTVLLQWATGGLVFFWWTARRQVVGIGYGWLLRGVYGALAGLAVFVETRSDHSGAGHVVAIVAGSALVLATFTAFALSYVRRARDDRAPHALDVVAPACGAVGLLGLAAVTGGAYWLVALRLLTGAVFLGSITDAMLLGHWYLVQPGLSRAPLEELVRICLFVWPLEVFVLLLPPGMVGIVAGNTDDGYGGLLGWMWVVSAITTVGLVYVTRLALREKYYSAVMAATGLLYLAILTAFGTDVVARAARALARVPPPRGDAPSTVRRGRERRAKSGYRVLATDEDVELKLRNEWWPALVVFVACVAAVAIHVAAYTPIGPVDETAHIDYVHRISSGELPAVGDHITDAIRREVACRGIESPVGFGDTPDCHGTRTNRQLPEDGYANESSQPPLYYAVTAVVSAILPIDGEVNAMRTVGGLWLAVGAVAVFLTLRQLRVARSFAMAATLVLALGPGILYGASSVDNDIAVWTFGALGLLFVVTVLQRPRIEIRDLVIGLLLGVAGGLTKPTALLVLVALALVVVLSRWSTEQRRSAVALGGVMIGGAVLATGVWAVVVQILQHQPLADTQPYKRLQVDTFPFENLVKGTALSMFTPLTAAFVPKEWRTDRILSFAISVAIYVEIGLLLLPLLARWITGIARDIGLAYLVVVVISGPYYVFFFYVTITAGGQADTRFVFGLMPFLAVVLATRVPRVWQRWTAAAIIGVPALWYLLLLTGFVTAASP